MGKKGSKLKRGRILRSGEDMAPPREGFGSRDYFAKRKAGKKKKVIK